MLGKPKLNSELQAKELKALSGNHKSISLEETSHEAKHRGQSKRKVSRSER
jgi:hypothetical protein